MMNIIQKRIFEIIAIKIGGANRDEICDMTSMPRTTVYDNLVKLEKMKFVEKYSKSNGMRGRPIVYWRAKGDNNS